MKNFITSIIISFTIILSGSTYAFADSSTLASDTMPPTHLSASGDITPQAGDTSYVIKEISRERKDMLFINYFKDFPEWAKVSTYNLASGKTYNISGKSNFKGVDITIGVSFSNSSSRSIPADSSKFSKLGAYADVTLIKKERIKYVGGVKVSSEFFGESIVHQKYIDVVYK